MKHIFYFIGIFFIISELLWVLSPQSKIKKSKRLYELTKEHKGKNWDEYPQEYKDIILSKLPDLFFMLWLFAGLLTFNWFSFLLIISINVFVVYPISKLTRFSVAYTALHWVNSVIGLSFGVFVVINSYHLKIDVYELFKSIFLN